MISDEIGDIAYRNAKNYSPGFKPRAIRAIILRDFSLIEII